jgi:DNA-binding NtrC family response regulator
MVNHKSGFIKFKKTNVRIVAATNVNLINEKENSVKICITD